MEAGLLPVDKPVGPTSHDVVAQARRAFGLRRIGHTGTLDPFASGLLLLCLGPATRLAEYWLGLDKTYEATMRLGSLTDTLDIDGVEVAQDDHWRGLEATSVHDACGEMRGLQAQMPPAFSAKKVKGVRAYARARAGEAVELAPVSIQIHELRCTRVSLPDVSFVVRCSSGTYVRAIARDLGKRLGTGAHLTSLRRTAIGRMSVRDAVSVDDFADAARCAAALIPPRDALPTLDTIEIDSAETERIRLGQALPAPSTEDGLVALVSGPTLVAVASVEDGTIRPKKVFQWS